MRDNWETVATFSGPIEAHLARARLEAEGIPCMVMDEYLVRIDWLLSNAIGGVKLVVPSGEAARARDALRPRPRLVETADEHTPEGELSCPRCRSLDVYFHRFDRRVAALAWLVVGFIVPWRRRAWVCAECGYAWRERRPARPRAVRDAPRAGRSGGPVPRNPGGECVHPKDP